MDIAQLLGAADTSPALLELSREELEQLIDRAVRSDIPVRVLFEALDRYSAVMRVVLGRDQAG